MQYPNRVVKIGERDAVIVKAVADALAARGVSVHSPPGAFDASLASSVQLFQSLHRDLHGKPLVIDGKIGPLTWGALFGAGTLAAPPAASGALAARALEIAIGEIGTMEDPVGSNSGTRVEAYLRSTGLPGGHFWCMAFVHWCFAEAARTLGVPNRFPRTPGVLDAWNKSAGSRIDKATALTDLSWVGPGAVFIMDYGNSLGHTGIVRHNDGGLLTTIEGNADPEGGRNGIGVFELRRRSISAVKMKGFIILAG
jgi:hypothetical protein